jgi:hypothetical protein
MIMRATLLKDFLWEGSLDKKATLWTHSGCHCCSGRDMGTSTVIWEIQGISYQGSFTRSRAWVLKIGQTLKKILCCRNG